MSATQFRTAGSVHEQAQASPGFRALRRRLRRFVFPMSALVFGWYLAYVLLASYAKPFMAIKLAGNVTVGLALGLLQFVSTFVITTRYVRRAVDPAAAEVRRRMGQ